MKKILAIGFLAASFVAPSAFGQGYFQFTTGKSQAYDGFTTAGTSALSSNVRVSFLWAPAATATPMPVASTPTTGNSLTSASYDVATAWAAINNNSDSWTLAVNQTGGNVLVQTLTAANGGISYFGGAGFGVQGTSAGTYSIMMISWNGAYADPTAAALAGSAVGWSSVFQYNAVGAANDPGIANMAGKAAGFGTFVPAAVPEPGTMALAALGGASLLLFRRRK